MIPILIQIRRFVPIGAAAVALAWSVACRAGVEGPVPAHDAAEGSDLVANGKSDTPDVASPRPRAPRQQVRKAPGHGIEETVRRLTHGLDLDPTQQMKLREILWDEQRQARKLRENPAPGIDWPSVTAAIVDQTKARIRAMLTDTQKAKYSVEVPHDRAAPAQADLQHWMQLQETQRQQDDAVSK